MRAVPILTGNAAVQSQALREGPALVSSKIVVLLLLLATLLILFVPAAPAAAQDVVQPTAEQQRALDRINQYRALSGVAPVRLNRALTNAAVNHANYYILNYGQPGMSGMALHDEVAGRPGFTGATMEDRIEGSGYTGSWNEGMALLGDAVAAVDAFMATVNHRLPIMDPAITDIGYGGGVSGRARVDVFTYGGVYSGQRGATITPEFTAYPADGQTGVPPTYRGDETNNAFADANYPVGTGITLKYSGPGTLQLSAASVRGPDGANLPLLTASNYNYATRNVIVVSARDPLQSDTRYTVRIEGTKNGTPFVQSWSFTTGSGGAPGPKLAATAPDPRSQFQALWSRTDGPLAANQTTRSWSWGPKAFDERQEPFSDAPGGTRLVDYYDKGRMEINDPAADQSNPWYVSTGLLVWEMVAGKVQTGNDDFQDRAASGEAITGDTRAANPDAPSYAMMRGVTSIDGDNGTGDKTGLTVTNFLDKDGAVSVKPEMAGYGVRLASFRPETGHNVADRFVDYLGQQGTIYENGALTKGLLFDWIYMLGYPISEPYWVTARVEGRAQNVLVQLFQRRTLTYIPGFPAEWRVQMGNVGQHYFAWRYGQ